MKLPQFFHSKFTDYPHFVAIAANHLQLHAPPSPEKTELLTELL